MRSRASTGHRLARILLLASFAAASLPLGTPFAAAATTRPPTGVASATMPAAGAVDPGIQPLVPQLRPLSKVVYGYLPYWNLDSATAGRLKYPLLSTIALFGLGIKADGSIDTAWRGYTAYMSADAVAVTNAAHAAGVRVVPTFQLFDSANLLKMTAFLGSAAAQSRFIGQALNLMSRRSADGANLDFEPLPASQTAGFLAFVERFGTAMRARFPGSTLVVATSAGAGADLVTGLVPLVDQMFVMTYGYNTSTAKVAGAIAPLDNAPRTVRIHIDRFRGWAPATKIILGIGYYGYDWPVTSTAPNATVQADAKAHGGVWSVSYGSAMDWLAAHPSVTRHEDTAQGSGYFTYYDSASTSTRQVYFEDEYSIAAKDDYAIATGLGGIGIWTLGNDGTYPQLWNTIQTKFYSPTHSIAVGSAVANVRLSRGVVVATITRRIRNLGSVPERGAVRWVLRDAHARVRASGSIAVLIYPGRSAAWRSDLRIGTAAALPAGRYRLYVVFAGSRSTWHAPTISFRQPY